MRARIAASSGLFALNREISVCIGLRGGAGRFTTIARFAGAAHECKAALLVNPYDPDSVAAAIGQALSMPLAERRERHDALFQVLSHNDIQHWADRFLTALDGSRSLLSQLEKMPFMG
jgi:trehalose-6-phosphate synthase